METPYDWITVAIFAGLIVLFMQRSTSDQPAEKGDSLIWYLVGGVGCAVANYLGNNGYNLLAVLMIVGTLGFIVHFLKPFKSWPKA